MFSAVPIPAQWTPQVSLRASSLRNTAWWGTGLSVITAVNPLNAALLQYRVSAGPFLWQWSQLHLIKTFQTNHRLETKSELTLAYIIHRWRFISQYNNWPIKKRWGIFRGGKGNGFKKEALVRLVSKHFSGNGFTGNCLVKTVGVG